MDLVTFLKKMVEREACLKGWYNILPLSMALYPCLFFIKQNKESNIDGESSELNS